jgi:EAL domain-containing protein (putative c-di-GMP-specific phosphodiesterase class I)
MSVLKPDALPPEPMATQPTRCVACRDATPLPFGFTMAFQPIVDIVSDRIWGHEALVRGTAGEGAAFVLDQVSPALVYGFDQACRVRAVELAGRLFPDDGDVKLSINFMPNAVYEPNACIRTTLAAARRVGFDPGRLMFEFTENEKMRDVPHLHRIIDAYRAQGFTTAIDDFGAGFAGLGLLSELRPDVLKIDMALIRDIDRSATKRAIVGAIVAMADAIGIIPLAEGIETAEELAVLRGFGIRLCQGYLLGRPALAPA